MPENQKITDFKPGDIVRAASDYWAPQAAAAGLPSDTDLTVAAVHHRSTDGFSGWLELVGFTNNNAVTSGPNGSFGHLLLNPTGRRASDIVGAVKPVEPEVVNPDVFAVGDRVKITDRRTKIGPFPVGSGESGLVGKLATITQVRGGGTHLSYGAKVDGDDFTTGWTHDALDIVEPEPVGRPTIDFSGSSRETARTYAGDLMSRVLKPESNQMLEDVAMGETVDAYCLNAALTDAMRSAITRAGQSSARREMGKKVAHLAHICQAVLDNHADSLPAYEKGERSRVAHEAKRALVVLENENILCVKRIDELIAERATLTQAASDERRRLCSEIDGLKAIIARDNEVEENLRDSIAKLDLVKVGYKATLDFVMINFLSDSDLDKVEGFAAGFKTAQQPDA